MSKRLEEIKNNGVCVCLHLETKYKYEKTAAAAVLCMCMNFFAPCIKRKLFFIYMRGRKKLENTAIIESQHSSGGNSGIMLPENGKKLA